jgi:hypothetical protein
MTWPGSKIDSSKLYYWEKSKKTCIAVLSYVGSTMAKAK